MVSKFVTYSGRTLYYGLTEDAKPTDAPNGACYTDIETGDEYWFDKENDGWYAPDGSFIPNPHEDEEGDEEVMFVDFIIDVETTTCNKSITEIVNSLKSGKLVVGRAVNDVDNPTGIGAYLYPTSHESGDVVGVVFQSIVRKPTQVMLGTLDGWIENGEDVWSLMATVLAETEAGS